MYYFSKKIKCLDCGKNYKGIKERNDRKVYICAGYANYKNLCTRWKVDEELLIELIYNHYEITLLKDGLVEGKSRKPIEKPTIDLESILDRVVGVGVSPKEKSLRIDYMDGTSTKIELNHQSYWSC